MPISYVTPPFSLQLPSSEYHFRALPAWLLWCRCFHNVYDLSHTYKFTLTCHCAPMNSLLKSSLLVMFLQCAPRCPKPTRKICKINDYRFYATTSTWDLGLHCNLVYRYCSRRGTLLNLPSFLIELEMSIYWCIKAHSSIFELTQNQLLYRYLVYIYFVL